MCTSGVSYFISSSCFVPNELKSLKNQHVFFLKVHPSHSMGWCIYKEAQILPQCSAIILSDLKLLFIILLPISRIDKRIFYTKTSSTQSSPMFIRSELSLTLNIEEIRSCLNFFFQNSNASFT